MIEAAVEFLLYCLGTCCCAISAGLTWKLVASTFNHEGAAARKKQPGQKHEHDKVASVKSSSEDRLLERLQEVQGARYAVPKVIDKSRISTQVLK